MALPVLAPLPPSTIRLSLAPPEWEACLDAWLTLSQLYLRLPAEDLHTNAGALLQFLPAYYHQLAIVQTGDDTLLGLKARQLQKACFALLGRTVSEECLPQDAWTWEILSDVCHVHMRSAALGRLMKSLWKRRTSELETMLQKKKVGLTNSLDSSEPQTAAQDLARLAAIVRASPDAGVFFMAGSDFLDSLTTSYVELLDDQRKPVVSVAYLGLMSLVKTEHANISALSDCLYSLKSQADKQSGTATLIADLVTNTPLLAKLRPTVSGKPTERLLKVLDTLETYRMPSIARPRKHVRRKASKGKGEAPAAHGDLYIHCMSLVTQIQDLFPDLGAGFVLRLMDEYSDNVEIVTAHLLDDSLPPHLQSLDRTEQAPIYDTDAHGKVEHLAPRSLPPPQEPFVPERKNVFDDDELLSAQASRLHIGKANRNESAGKQPSNKAAILSALAAFDADDDERDDTYDVEDVGGTIDTAHPDGEPGPSAKVRQEENDMALFSAYKSSPELFGRTFDVRRGQARAALKSETGMTDEAIEGWAIMLQRDPRRLKKLEERFGTFDGRQNELQRTAYRESPAGTETEDSDAPNGPARGGFRGGRGRGRGARGSGGRGGRGGSVAGPSSEAGTANAQRKKEANKGSRANHDRRDQRAKKMARGGFAG